MEDSSNIEGFLLYSGFSGGFGSGFTSRLVQSLENEFAKTIKIHVALVPSPMLNQSVLEPYNTILAESSLLDHVDSAFYVDNESLYKVCQNNNSQFKSGLELTYPKMNMLIGDLSSKITSSLRHESDLNATMNEIVHNLVPNSRLHHHMSAIVPCLNSNRPPFNSYTKLTTSLFELNTSFISCDFSHGKFLRMAILYCSGEEADKLRKDNKQNEIDKAVNTCIKDNKTIQFANEQTESSLLQNIKAGPVSIKSPSKNMSACLLSTTSATGEYFRRVGEKFNRLHSKQAYLHLYAGEGMDLIEFSEAREDVLTLEHDYETLLK